MGLIGDFLVFFLVYGSLHYLFTERKRPGPAGIPRPTHIALLRSAATAAFAGALFVLFMEVIEIV